MQVTHLDIKGLVNETQPADFPAYQVKNYREILTILKANEPFFKIVFTHDY